MSRWAVVIAGLAAVVFLSLPLLLGRTSRSGRMARWDAHEESSSLSKRHQRIAWRMRLGICVFFTAAFLGLTLLSLARREFVNALLAAAFLAFRAGLLLMAMRVHRSS